MSVRSTLAQSTALASTIAGPVLGAAEASGAFGADGHKLAMYIASGALTVVGGLASLLFWFVKREYTSIIEGVARLELAMGSVSTTVTELRGEVARRVSVEDHSRSAGALHEKINRLAQDVAHVRGKLGLGRNEEEPQG